MLHVGVRVCVGVRPEGRVGPEGFERWAERKEEGASLAKVRAGKVRGWGVGWSVIGAVRVGGVVDLEELGVVDFWTGKAYR